MIKKIIMNIEAAWNCLKGNPTIYKVTFLQGMVLDISVVNNNLLNSSNTIHNIYKEIPIAAITYAKLPQDYDWSNLYIQTKTLKFKDIPDKITDDAPGLVKILSK